MRIGIVSEYVRPWPGGVSEHVHHEARELRRLGHEVQVISGPREHGRGEGEDGVLRAGRALTFTSNGARSRLAYGAFAWRMRARLAALELDVLHVHAPLDPLLPLVSVLSSSCPVVGTFHASFSPAPFWDLLYGKNPLARAAAHKLLARIAVSAQAERSIARYLPGRYRLIPNGVDLERFSPASREPVPRERLRVLYVGRADPRKGLALLLEAHQLLRRRGLAVELVICGPSPSELAAVLASSSREALEGVRVTGYLSPEALPSQYAQSDLFCSPALGSESQGVVLLEAMASGLPCVCFDIPGYREVVRDGVEGVLVREQSATALADALHPLLEDEPKRRALAAGAVERAASFAWPKIAKALEEELERAAKM